MVDKYEKRAIITTAVVLMVFFFSLLYATASRKADLPVCQRYDKAYETPRVDQLDKHTFQVFAVAKMWSFQPAEIYIPVGSEVDFYLTSLDVVHGFIIYEKNVNMMAVYGGITQTTVHFDKPGIYNIVCHEYCGAGHQTMQAQVIVNYPDIP
jgi:cytochrome c oxidase subunit II